MMWIPNVSTLPGSVLTAQNWQEAGVECIAYSLHALLLKPGAFFLKTLTDFSRYTGWTLDWILNCTLSLQEDLISPYDGSRVRFTSLDIVGIILNLKPTYTILPLGFYEVGTIEIQKLAAMTSLFVSKEEVMHYTSQVSVYEENIYETDDFALDALRGVVYCRTGNIDIRDPAFSLQFEPLDATCNCQTCKQNLTRAYLHYLFTHTPLLCQRFLVWHNMSYR